MMRPRSRGSESEEPSEEALLDVELARLQRSYRVMQNDYKAYKEETKRIITKQKTLIDQLEKEREELDTMLGKMETTQNKCKDEQNTKALRELSKAEKDHQALVKTERENIKQLDTQINAVEKQICKQRKNMGGVHNSTAKHISVQKQKAVLENRLDKAVVYFNRQLATNTQLRTYIDHFRRERAVFENLYKRLAKELDHSKRDMTDVIATSSQAFEQRDEAQSKMMALKERNDKDSHQHDVEMKDLQRTISHDNKTKAFMNIKASDRQEYKAEEAAKKKKDDKGLGADQATIQTYEEAFRLIQEVTGEQDIDVMVDNFIKNEGENFALFNYVNELNSEVELLQESVYVVKQDIDKFKTEDSEVDTKRSLLMKHLENGYQQAQFDTDRAESRLKGVNKVLDQLRSGIGGMFQTLGCDPGPVREMLSGDAGVSNNNVMVYLGQIEHKTTELLHAMHYIQLKQSKIEGQNPQPKKDAALPSGPLYPPINVAAPPVRDDGEPDEDQDVEEIRPFTQSELREKIGRDLDRKQLAQAQVPPPKPGPSGSRSIEGKKRKGAGKKRQE